MIIGSSKKASEVAHLKRLMERSAQFKKLKTSKELTVELWLIVLGRLLLLLVIRKVGHWFGVGMIKLNKFGHLVSKLFRRNTSHPSSMH